MSKDAEKTKRQPPAPKQRPPEIEKPAPQRSLFDWARAEFRIKSINTAIAIFALLVSIASLFLAADTSNIKTAIQTLTQLAAQTRRQADMTAAEVADLRRGRRPWISVTVEVGDLSWSATGASLPALVTLRNSGQLPARIHGLELALQTPFAQDTAQRPVNWIRARAKKMRSETVPSQNIAVFPGQSQTFKVQLVLPRANVQSFLSYVSTTHPFIPLAIAYAADYVSSQGGHGQTYCWLSLEQKDPANPDSANTTPRIDVNVASASLVLLNESNACASN